MAGKHRAPKGSKRGKKYYVKYKMNGLTKIDLQEFDNFSDALDRTAEIVLWEGVTSAKPESKDA